MSISKEAEHSCCHYVHHTYNKIKSTGHIYNIEKDPWYKKMPAESYIQKKVHTLDLRGWARDKC